MLKQKVLVLAMILLVVTGLQTDFFSCIVYADEEDFEPEITVTVEEVEDEGALQQISDEEFADYITDFNELVAETKGYVKNRTESFTVKYASQQQLTDDEAKTVYYWVGEHNGKGDEGDYLIHNIHKSDMHVVCTAEYTAEPDVVYYCYDFEFSFAYFSTLQEEQQLTEKLNQIYQSLGLDAMSEYDKLQTIYRYICENVDYDRDGYLNAKYHNDIDPEIYSATAALLKGKAVCNGYALLLYRMALDNGIDCRFVLGFLLKGGSDWESHAWNLIRVGDKYYYADWTGADFTLTRYFLYGSETYADHKVHITCLAEFEDCGYTISKTDYDKDSGFEGGNPVQPGDKPEEKSEYKVTLLAGEHSKGFKGDDGKYTNRIEMTKAAKHPLGEMQIPEAEDGYIFVGWKIDGMNSLFETMDMYGKESENSRYIEDYYLKTDITVTAQFKKSFTVTFKDETGAGFYGQNGNTYVKEYTVVEGKSLYEVPYVDEEQELVFAGWKRVDTGEFFSYSDFKLLKAFVPDKDGIVFLAQYTTNITITYKKAEGSQGYSVSRWDGSLGKKVTEIKDEYISYALKGEVLYEKVPPVIAPEGKMITGYKDSEGKFYPLSSMWGEIRLNKNVELTPVFGDYYKVTLDAGIAYFKTLDVVKGRYDSRKTIAIRVPKGDKIGVANSDLEYAIYDKYEDLKLLGWKDSNGVFLTKEELYSYTPTKNTTLDAIWNYDSTVISYRTHVQSYGWQDFVYHGNVSGTVGQAKRLEGIEIKLDKKELGGGIEYRTHVQSIGWQDWKHDGEMSGTSGRAKRLEAIQIRLTGKIAEEYDVYYRVQAQSYGWLGWAKNGETAGTEGLSKRLEAIQIMLVRKDRVLGSNEKYFGVKLDDMAKITSSTKQTPGVACISKNPFITYRTHVQSFGWQNFVSNGAMSGTSGQAKRLEGIEINVGNLAYSGGIRYKTHIQKIGWQDWKSNGAMSGTAGQSLRLEAIAIELTGEAAKHYDVYYRVHAQGYGWLGWAKNGQNAGTAGLAKRLEGIQIILVEKGKPAPGKTYNGITSTNDKTYISK